MSSKIVHLKEVDSTNTYAADHFDSLEDGTLVLAEKQTAGHGRLGRRWASPEGGIYASFIMKDLFGEPFHATLVSSLAVLAAVNEIIPGSGAFIKWPNDIYVGHKKLCGILCEGAIRNGKLSGIICGIGVNVNMSADELGKIDQPATSLEQMAARKIDLTFFTEKLMVYLNWYYTIGIDSLERLFSMWKKENRIIGQTVMLLPPQGSQFKALVKDIAEDGRLVAEHDGKEETFACGDVKILLE